MFGIESSYLHNGFLFKKEVFALADKLKGLTILDGFYFLNENVSLVGFTTYKEPVVDEYYQGKWIAYDLDTDYIAFNINWKNRFSATLHEESNIQSDTIFVQGEIDGDILDSMVDAVNKYGTVKSAISLACNPDSNVKYAGTSKDGEKLMWDYYDAYLAKLNGEEYDYTAHERVSESTLKVAVRCKETGEEFESLTEAAKVYNTTHGSISSSCNQSHGTGIHPDTGQTLHWEYIKENNSDE